MACTGRRQVQAADACCIDFQRAMSSSGQWRDDHWRAPRPVCMMLFRYRSWPTTGAVEKRQETNQKRVDEVGAGLAAFVACLMGLFFTSVFLHCCCQARKMGALEEKVKNEGARVHELEMKLAAFGDELGKAQALNAQLTSRNTELVYKVKEMEKELDKARS